MPFSVRLDKDLEVLLERTAQVLETNRTEVVRRSLSQYCTQLLKEREKRPYQLIVDLVGKEGSGRGDLSLRGEEILRAAFRRKR